MIQCPDCPAQMDATNHLSHDDTCPLGLATDETCLDDRRFFDANPGVRIRCRPLFPMELAEFRAMDGVRLPGHRQVRVYAMLPGVRRRQYASAAILDIDPNLSPEVAQKLRTAGVRS